MSNKKTKYYIKGKYIFKDLGVRDNFTFNSIKKHWTDPQKELPENHWLMVYLVSPAEEKWLNDKQLDRLLSKGMVYKK